jgi:hypothetical protein
MGREFMFEFRWLAPPGKKPISKANIKQLHEAVSFWEVTINKLRRLILPAVVAQ